MDANWFPISGENFGRIIEIASGVGTLIIAWITLEQQEQIKENQEQIKALSQLVKSSQFLKPAMFKVINYEWEDMDDGRMRIILQNIGKPLFLEDAQWIVGNRGGLQHNSFSVTNNIDPSTLFLDIDNSRNRLNAMIFPAMIDTEHRICILTRYNGEGDRGTGANMSLVISFIDAEGERSQQKLLGHPYNVIYTGNIQKGFHNY